MWNELRKKKKNRIKVYENRFENTRIYPFIQAAGYVMVFLVGFNLKKEIVSSPFLAYN